MTPERALFRTLFAMMEQFGNVFDELPSPDEKYPFIFIRQSDNENESNSDMMGTVDFLIDVYGTRYDGAIMDEIKVRINNGFIRLEDAFNYNVRCIRLNMSDRKENNERQTLNRVIITASFEYTKKER